MRRRASRDDGNERSEDGGAGHPWNLRRAARDAYAVKVRCDSDSCGADGSHAAHAGDRVYVIAMLSNGVAVDARSADGLRADDLSLVARPRPVERPARTERLSLEMESVGHGFA
jgi:hypothetical protein